LIFNSAQRESFINNKITTLIGSKKCPLEAKFLPSSPLHTSFLANLNGYGFDLYPVRKDILQQGQIDGKNLRLVMLSGILGQKGQVYLDQNKCSEE